MKKLLKFLSLGILLFSLSLSPILAQAEKTSSIFLSNEEPLSITRSDDFGWGGEKFVAGTTNITFEKFQLTNNGDNNVEVHSITLKAFGNGNAQPFSNFTLGLFINEVLQGTLHAFDENGLAYFNDISVVIPANGKIEFCIKLNTLEVSAPGTLQINVIDVQSTNTETKKMVSTLINNQKISLGNPLWGPFYEFIESGILTVERGTLIEGTDLIENEENVNILQIRFSAEYDNIQIKDIYLENDFNGDGLYDFFSYRSAFFRFKLYDHNDEFIQESTFQGETLHFELPIEERINVQKGTSTFVTIKVDVPERIFNAKPFRLALDTDNNFKGIQAITTTTGSDIDTPLEGWGDAVSEAFFTATEPRGEDDILWQINLTAQNGISRDLDNYLGTHHESNDTYEYSDRPEVPPVPWNFVQLTFPHEEWELGYFETFTTDIRSPLQPGEEKIWEFEVNSDLEGNEMLLQWNSPDIQEHHFILTNLETQDSIDMDEVNSYSYSHEHGRHEFSITVTRNE